VAAEFVSTEEREWIQDVLRKKADAVEAATISLEPFRAAGIRSELERYEAATASLNPPTKAKSDELDSMLRTWIAR